MMFAGAGRTGSSHALTIQAQNADLQKVLSQMDAAP